MSDIALYHPYVNFPDDTWLKAAVLHWPRIARMRPRDYFKLSESDVVKELRDEIDFLRDLDPWQYENDVDALFYKFLERHCNELLPRYGVHEISLTSQLRGFGENRARSYEDIDPHLAEVHPGKVSRDLAKRLAGEGLLVRLDYVWKSPIDGKEFDATGLWMHRRLAQVYLAALAAETARHNQMSTITDQPLPQAGMAGWTVDALASVLLTDDDNPSPQEDGDLVQAFSILALQTVLPGGLAEMPVSRIVEARRRLMPELKAYRGYLDSIAPRFVELAEVHDPEVRADMLRIMVETEISDRIAKMDREIRRLGMKPVRAVLSAQTLAPPAVLGVLTNSAGLPPSVTATGVIAGCFVGASAAAFRERVSQREGHPTGYLLGLRNELKPSDAVAHIRRAFRRASTTLRRSH